MTAEEYKQAVKKLRDEYLQACDLKHHQESLKKLNITAEKEFLIDFEYLLQHLSRNLPPKVWGIVKGSKNSFTTVFLIPIETHEKIGSYLKRLASHTINTTATRQIKTKLAKYRQTLEIVLLKQYPNAPLSIYY
jgi:hypothetical protein